MHARRRRDRCPRKWANVTRAARVIGLRWCALKGQGQISPGQSVAPPRVVVANGSGSPEGATQTDASIVPPLQGFLAALIRYPGAAATLAPLASPCPGLVCPAPSGQRPREREDRAAPRAEPSRHDDGWPGSDSRTRDAKKNACHRRGRAVGWRSADWATVVQRRTHRSPRTKRCNRAAFTPGGMNASSCRGRLIAVVRAGDDGRVVLLSGLCQGLVSWLECAGEA
jgi:hypothetical protein